MSEGGFKWMLGLVALGMAADTLVSRPASQVETEHHFRNLVPQHVVQGFASERQWLFAHRKFRNQCVLEALAAEEQRAGELPESATVQLDDISRPLVRVTNTY